MAEATWSAEHRDKLVAWAVFAEPQRCHCGEPDALDTQNAVYLERWLYYNCRRCHTTRCYDLRLVLLGVFNDAA